MFQNSPPDETRNSLHLVAHWTACIGDRTAMEKVLADLSRLVSACTLQIERRMAKLDRTMLLARYDAARDQIPARPLRNYSELMLDENLHYMKSGSICTLERGTRQIEEELEAHGLRDIVIIVLGNEADHSDFVELHFEQAVRAHDFQLLEMLAPVFASAWKKRPPASASAMMCRHANTISGSKPQKHHVLSVHNPCRLTRSEFRICSLIHDGMLARSICDRIGVSHSTMRSHMRSIYMKCGVSSQVELVHLLSGATEGGSGFAASA